MRRPGHTRRQASVDYPRYPPVNSTTQQPPANIDMVSQTILASDYESDNQGYVSDYPGVSAPITRSKDDLNLIVLRRWNSDVHKVLAIAPYATIYEYAAATNEWQKSGLVGTLFICQLTPGQYGEERYRAIVLNRSGLENFEAELRQSDRGGVSISGDYVEITREDPDTNETKVNAIYIYSEDNTSTADSRRGNADLMVALANVAKISRESQEATWFQPVRQIAPPSPQIQPPVYEQVLSVPERVQIPQQPSPTPPVAPVPARQVDLLALLRGHQSNAESIPPRPPQQAQAVNVMDLFRNSGAM